MYNCFDNLPPANLLPNLDLHRASVVPVDPQVAQEAQAFEVLRHATENYTRSATTKLIRLDLRDPEVENPSFRHRSDSFRCEHTFAYNIGGKVINGEYNHHEETSMPGADVIKDENIFEMKQVGNVPENRIITCVGVDKTNEASVKTWMKYWDISSKLREKNYTWTCVVQDHYSNYYYVDKCQIVKDPCTGKRLSVELHLVKWTADAEVNACQTRFWQ